MNKTVSSGDSARSLDKLLTDMHSSPISYSGQEYLTMLATQASLAAYENSTLGIKKVSLNTLKSSSNQNITGGFASIEFKRKSALALITHAGPTAEHGGKRNKAQLLQDIALLETQVNQYEEDLTHLSQAFWRALTAIRRLAEKSAMPSLVAEATDEDAKLRLMASIMSRRLRAVVP